MVTSKLTEMLNRQKAELDAMVTDPVANELIIRMMTVTSLGFMALNIDQMRLYIKFLIETVDAHEEIEKQLCI